MTTGDQLFAAIREAPEDETLRLVYADWLEEQGNPRAEFIRVQCALARLPVDEPRGALEVREAELLREHLETFRPPRLDRVEWGGFYRGFVDRCRFASPRNFLARAAEAFELAPLRAIGMDLPRFARDVAPAGFVSMVERIAPLGRLTELDSSAMPGSIFDALLQSPALTGLRSLRVPARATPGAAEDAALPDFLTGPVFPRVETLTCEAVGARDEWVAALADSARFPGLRALNLSRNRHLKNVAVLGNLRANLAALNLAEVEITPAQARALLHGPATAGLERLNLGYTKLGNAALVSLAEAPCRATLQELRLVGVKTDAGGIAALARTDWPALEELVLNRNDLGRTAAHTLARALLPKLRRLNLVSCELGDAGAIALARSPLRGLTVLDLSHNRIGSAGIAALAESELVRGLRELRLLGNPVGSQGALALVRSPHLAGLQRLQLRLEDVGDAPETLGALLERFPSWTG